MNEIRNPNQWLSLVTGCSSGIGRALARELSTRGGRCFASARDADVLARPCAPREVRLGKGTGFLPVLTRLPRAWRDRLFARQFGVGAIAD